MNITICDDCQMDIDRISFLCQSYATTNKLIFNIMQTTDPSTLNLQAVDLLFLDICMPQANGIDIQRKLEISTNKPLIIFVTNYQEYLPISHGTNVVGFLEKPVKKRTLISLLDRVRALLDKGKTITWINNCVFNTNQIQYIFMDAGVSKAVLSNNEISCGYYKTIKTWTKELQNYGFIRINQSCLVNCLYVDRFTNGKIVLKSGEVLFTSRREKRNSEEMYIQYLERHAKFL